MIYIEFTQRQCNEQDFIHDISETDCKLTVRLENDYLDLILDELFYETDEEDIALVLLNKLEKVLTDLEVSYSIIVLDYITKLLLEEDHSFIQLQEFLLSK
ncbi:hypothetical protein [Enterococcus sp. AZ102]|uniref:hypothetical protein n=1 Tax=Enterococcus sp. AZ102 TaxID=2774865 RepID=UPI003F264447